MSATIAPLQRFNSSGRLETVPPPPAAASIDPFPYSEAVGFRIEPRPHGMAALIDPQGHPCGIFASERLAPRTLQALAFFLR